MNVIATLEVYKNVQIERLISISSPMKNLPTYQILGFFKVLI
jgi:hypothetical protein